MSSWPSFSRATAFIGSIVACARKGTRYSASSTAPSASAWSTLPSSRSRLSGFVSVIEATMDCIIAAVLAG